MLHLYDDIDARLALAAYLKQKRKDAKLSRRALAEKSLIPEPTIRRFEDTGHISLKNFLLLWMILDDIARFMELTKPKAIKPKTIAEVLAYDK